MEVFIGLMIVGVFCWRLVFLGSLLIVCALAKSLGVSLEHPLFAFARKHLSAEEKRLQARRDRPSSTGLEGIYSYRRRPRVLYRHRVRYSR